ncbi:MAG: Spy/CpxP family protein refolding chaperone [Leptolyngbyaceae bacterium]|nr:Spy/CpxP family protein refolding chaperone [Leptolyngbyaceae bacterium]
MKQKYLALLATLPVLIGVSSLAAVAQVRGENDGWGDRPPRFEERREQWIEQLDLTEAQQAEIQAIREQASTENEGLRQELEEAHATMRSLMESNASADQIRQQHDQIQQLHQQLGDAMLDVRLDIREVLTEEQRSQLAELLPDRPFRGGGGQHHRGGRF